VALVEMELLVAAGSDCCSGSYGICSVGFGRGFVAVVESVGFGRVFDLRFVHHFQFQGSRRYYSNRCYCLHSKWVCFVVGPIGLSLEEDFHLCFRPIPSWPLIGGAFDRHASVPLSF